MPCLDSSLAGFNSSSSRQFDILPANARGFLRWGFGYRPTEVKPQYCLRGGFEIMGVGRWEMDPQCVQVARQSCLGPASGSTGSTTSVRSSSTPESARHLTRASRHTHHRYSLAPYSTLHTAAGVFVPRVPPTAAIGVISKHHGCHRQLPIPVRELPRCYHCEPLGCGRKMTTTIVGRPDV